MFKSVLFQDKSKSFPREAPSFFKDLNLDIIVEGISLISNYEKVSNFFYLHLEKEEDILYRQEISRDFEREEVFNCVQEFSSKMRSVRLYLERRDKLSHRYQKERWLLDAVLVYCQAVKELNDRLGKCHLESKGLSEFKNYLSDYSKSEKFSSLCKEAKNVEEELEEIRYVLYVKENKISVRKYESEMDYSAEILRIFEKFKQRSVKNYRVEFSETLDVNHVEAKILDFVGEIYSDVFSNLDSFCERHASFQDETIWRFEREVQFYLSYLEYISPLKKEGMRFYYPRFLHSKRMEMRALFDLALAQKLRREGKKVVCNDFVLKENERIAIVTGPNQGGKTTYARAIGQSLYLGTLGLPIPARQAEFFAFDELFTHFEKKESMNDLHGRLEDDIVRIHDILKKATNKSVIVMNEIFSSTTLQDALALGKRVLEEIEHLKATAILVTFMDELSKFNEHTVSMVSTVDKYNPNVRTYRILRMPANGLSYAVSLARKYGLTYEQLKERMKK